LNGPAEAAFHTSHTRAAQVEDRAKSPVPGLFANFVTGPLTVTMQNAAGLQFKRKRGLGCPFQRRREE